MLILLAFLLISVVAHEFSPEDIPRPDQNPLLCGRDQNTSPSWICDHSHLLDQETLDWFDSYSNQVGKMLSDWNQTLDSNLDHYCSPNSTQSAIVAVIINEPPLSMADFHWLVYRSWGFNVSQCPRLISVMHTRSIKYTTYIWGQYFLDHHDQFNNKFRKTNFGDLFDFKYSLLRKTKFSFSPPAPAPTCPPDEKIQTPLSSSLSSQVREADIIVEEAIPVSIAIVIFLAGGCLVGILAGVIFLIHRHKSKIRKALQASKDSTK